MDIVIVAGKRREGAYEREKTAIHDLVRGGVLPVEEAFYHWRVGGSRRCNVEVGERVWIVQRGYLRGFGVVGRVENRSLPRYSPFLDIYEPPGNFIYLPLLNWRWINPLKAPAFRREYALATNYKLADGLPLWGHPLVKAIGRWDDPMPPVEGKWNLDLEPDAD